MIHTSRSKIVSWFGCPRYRYLRYHTSGQGLQRVSGKHPTNAGLSIHAGNARLLRGDNLHDTIAWVTGTYETDFRRDYSGIPQAQDIMQEQLCMIEGSIRAFNRIRLPQLLADGEIIAIEQEQPIDFYDGAVYDFRADAIKHTDCGLVAIDFKPSPFGGYAWVKQWERNHQVLAYVWAMQQLYASEPVLGVQIEGYVRGRMKFDEHFGRKIQQTPLCYVYVNDFSGQISPDYQRAGDWNKVPLWDTSLSVQEYIEEFLTPQQVEGLFLSPVPPICPTPQQVESWRRQTVAQETRNEEHANAVEFTRLHLSQEDFEQSLDELFPQNMDHCLKYGTDYECEMAQICFNSQVREAPLESGLYEPRIDHHTTGEDE